MALGDPDTAGAPPKPTTKPTDATDYETELQYLQQQLSQEPRGVYVMSENRAKSWIILHCKAMKETYALMTYRTPEEVKTSMEDDRTGKTKANVNACTKEYSAKAIAANRKTAFEYCLPATTEKDGGRLLLNLCMHKHDMLTAMCKQQVDFMTAWRYHKDPQAQHAWGVCPADRVFCQSQRGSGDHGRTSGSHDERASAQVLCAAGRRDRPQAAAADPGGHSDRTHDSGFVGRVGRRAPRRLRNGRPGDARPGAGGRRQGGARSALGRHAQGPHHRVRPTFRSDSKPTRHGADRLHDRRDKHRPCRLPPVWQVGGFEEQRGCVHGAVPIERE